MIFINETHIKTVQAVNMIMKFPARKVRFFEKITLEYLKNPRDIEISLSYAFFKYLDITQIVQGEDLVNTDIKGVLEIYNRILDKNPEDWFVHLLKVLLFSKLSEIMDIEKERIATIDWMLRVQEQAIKKEHYFILPYIFYSEYWIEKKETLKAFKCIEKGIKEAPHNAILIPALSKHIFTPIKEFYYRLIFSEDYEFASVIKDIANIYFPLEATKLIPDEKLLRRA